MPARWRSEHFKRRDIKQVWREGVTSNTVANEANEKARTLVYTSTKTLSTDTGTRFYPMFSGQIVGVRAHVEGAPSGGDLSVDVWLNGVSIFNDTYVSIPSGQVYGYRKTPDQRIAFGIDDYFEVDIQTINSATGPLVVAIEYLPGSHHGGAATRG